MYRVRLCSRKRTGAESSTATGGDLGQEASSDLNRTSGVKCAFLPHLMVAGDEATP